MQLYGFTGHTAPSWELGIVGVATGGLFCNVAVCYKVVPVGVWGVQSHRMGSITASPPLRNVKTASHWNSNTKKLPLNCSPHSTAHRYCSPLSPLNPNPIDNKHQNTNHDDCESKHHLYDLVAAPICSLLSDTFSPALLSLGRTAIVLAI